MNNTYKPANFNVSVGRRLPVSKNEDVEYSEELADRNDKQAQDRGAAADERQES
nr:YfhD family protein [Paenibacillus swuensis]